MLPKPITIVTSESSSTCFVRSEEFNFGSSHALTTQTPAQVTSAAPSLLLVFDCDKDDQRNNHMFHFVQLICHHAPAAEY